MVKISVIIPVSNAEKHLARCLDSVINQTFTDLEVICVSVGYSKICDNILNAYRQFDNRIKVIKQKCKCASAARNYGLKHASGEFIVFVDPEDFLSPVALERMYNNVTQNDSDYVYSYMYKVLPDKWLFWDYPNIQLFSQHITKPVFNESNVGAEFYQEMTLKTSGNMYRKSFIKDFTFPENINNQEITFCTQCFLNAKRISYDFAALYFYRELSHIQSENILDTFEINKQLEQIFKDSDKFDKYKTVHLVYSMENILTKTLSATGELQETMFNKLQQTFANIDFSKYDISLLKRKNIYYAYQRILNQNYKEFQKFEQEVKNGK